MSPRRNMLEAFQDANDERRGGKPHSAGPFAGSANPSSAHERLDVMPQLSQRDSRALLAVAGIAIFSFIAGLALGRTMGEDDYLSDLLQQRAEAAGPGDGNYQGANQSGWNGAGGSNQAGSNQSGMGNSGAASQASPNPANSYAQQPNANSVGNYSAAHLSGPGVEQALQNQVNQYTVLAVTYGRSEAEEGYAQSTIDHFAKAGLPVARMVRSRDHLHVLLGAAPTRAELENLKASVREQSDPAGRRGAYDSAYVVPIDTYLRRDP